MHSVAFYISPARWLAWGLGLLFLTLRPALAQDKVSLKDAKEMTYQAQSTVEELQNLLNYVTFNDNAPSELAEVISSSYKPSRNQIFLSKDVIVEDDVNPASGLGKTKDLPVEKYLDALDVQYEKTADASVAFTNLVISKIKKKDYLYVKVRFDEAFASKEKASGTPYPTRQREALVRLNSLGGNKWQALIVGLSFHNPAQPIELTDNELPITTDASAESALVTQEDFVREKDDFVLGKQQEEKRKQIAYDEYVTQGNNYVASKQYKDALEFYSKAKELRALVPALDKKILDTKRLIAENTFESLKNKAEQAKSERRHGDALRLYKQALAIKPEARAAMEAEMAQLTKKLDEIALPKNKLEANDLQGAIDACDNILKENKKAKNDFPELFFIKAQAYQQLAEKQPGDTRSLDRALENYTMALQYYPNYTSARLARATFYVKHKHDYVSAVTDYDVLTANALDDAPEKPKYFLVKGGWKNQLKNYSGALEDYGKAIALSPENAAAHFDLAELLYRLQRHPEALVSFNTVLELEPKNGKAFYYRGLNYIGLRDVPAAGKDFGAAEALGLEPDQLKKVEAISTGYFEAALAAFKAKKTDQADSLYDNALAVRRCNAKAWHGKAEIALAAGDEQARKRNAASKSSYQTAIELYQKAIACTPTYSDAQYKKGLAYQKIAEYTAALDSYSDAIKSDATSVLAYMGRGNTHLDTKQYAKAIADYSRATTLLQNKLQAAKKDSQKEMALTISNDLSQAYQLMGKAWYLKNDYTKAVLLGDKALEVNPKNSEALYYQGLSYQAVHDLPKALKAYSEAIKYAPDFRYYYANGSASLQADKYEQAIANFNAAIKLDTLPVIKQSRYLRGLSYFKSRMLEPAFKDFTEYEKSVEKTDSSFYTDFGLLNLHLNHDAAAIDNFKRTLTAKPNHPLALYGLGCAYAKAGQFDKAMQQFEQAYQTRQLRKEDIKLEEETFLVELNKVKAHKTQYAQLKKTYLPAPQ
ncbi:tetratricopeptide repeat protein [Hymenobacter sp. 5317J-9]|uniref:tetratricopeptide repeat protein n=1 Tax=Hymenobacter sp. 5317J-9 TaxID=2932250 RepID=UPI001FD6E7CD|nr:tetratricopeptide repeat protein [Hymenobacter sp. 5317J-9]UOQ96713.1 tetratricopeptide repeat protein [Hymenobacter sp. 5317J-9]